VIATVRSWALTRERHIVFAAISDCCCACRPAMRDEVRIDTWLYRDHRSSRRRRHSSSVPAADSGGACGGTVGWRLLAASAHICKERARRREACLDSAVTHVTPAQTDVRAMCWASVARTDETRPSPPPRAGSGTAPSATGHTARGAVRGTHEAGRLAHAVGCDAGACVAVGSHGNTPVRKRRGNRHVV
jgi:hypothetical protein